MWRLRHNTGNFLNSLLEGEIVREFRLFKLPANFNDIFVLLFCSLDPASIPIAPIQDQALREIVHPFVKREAINEESASMTAQLVADALLMAVWRRGKPNELLHHSDQGSQYTSAQFQRLMADSGIVCGMSRSGNVWDNAAMESFFSSLKTERTARKIYRTRNEARADVFDYIERFYNAIRVIRRSDTSALLSSSARWD